MASQVAFSDSAAGGGALLLPSKDESQGALFSNCGWEGGYSR